MSRITTAQLAAQIAQLTSIVTKLVGEGTSVHATPAPVLAAVTAAPTLTLVTDTTVRPVITLVKPVKVAKVIDPAKVEAKAAAYALVKADREAISPMNKAFGKVGVKADTWATRWSNMTVVQAAFDTLTEAEKAAAVGAVNRRVERASK